MDAYESIRQMWRGFRVETVAALEQRLENFRILFAYHSGRIENAEITYHDTREIFENGKVLNFTGSPRAVMEQQNQKMCYEYLKEKIIQKAPVTLALVKQIHAILTAGTYDERRYVDNGERPGEFKKHDYMTGRYEVGSPPEDVEADMRELLEEINGYIGDSVLKTAAYLHAKFEYIHPFADGNGRVGRTLLNYYLLTRGEPPLIIYDEDKDRYYRALESYDSNEELEPLFGFLAEEMVKTWRETLERGAGIN
jgi:Fic family protein